MPTDATALAAAVAALVATVLVAHLSARLRRVERALRERGPGPDGPGTTGLRAEVDQLRAGLARVQADVATSLRHVAVVRYDAFADLGGRLSFSAALLDDAGDGLVVTSIAGRSETRTYAKGVVAGGSEHALSPEETDALRRALGDRPAARRRERV